MGAAGWVREAKKQLFGPLRWTQSGECGHQPSAPFSAHRKWVAPYEGMAWGCPVPPPPADAPKTGQVGLIQEQHQEEAGS